MLNTAAYIAIDQVQSAKKEFVKSFVKNEKLADILNTFVDTQAEYTKQATKATIDSVTALGKFITSPDTYKVQ